MADRHIEYIPINTIQSATRNPKRHADTTVQNSIGRFGMASPPVLDERTNRLVAGHGRLAALTAMRDAGQQPPEGIRTDDTGQWLIPVYRGWSSRSDAEADAYLVADNRHTELGGWDHAELADLLEGIGEIDPELVELTGWDTADLDDLLGGDEELEPPLTDPDDMPGPIPPVSEPGDVWNLGVHRLLCGDATDIAAVEAMLGGHRGDCMWTDPPYGVGYVGKTKDALTISNDSAGGLPDLLSGAFAVATVVLKPGAPVYVAHPPGALQCDFINAFDRAGWLWRQSLIWVKDPFVLGHGDYHYRHEPISYGFTAGGDGRLGRGGESWHGDNAQDSVFEVPKPIRNGDHPTMKPVKLISAMLANSCPPGGLVYEPFGGSGSTLIAAHQLGMSSALVELDPRYVDVICRRFQEHTGIVPERDLGGGATESHDFIVD
jgi:DNA modification methylase